MELQPIYEKLQIQEMNQMQKSTYQASENEQDIILLSPSTSSFDEFKGYEERGRIFKQYVNEK